MSRKPDSKTVRAREADKLLRRLLRTPKTRAGLIAAVASHKVSGNFVYGWLSENQRNGTVTVLKSHGRLFQYQISEHVVVETAAPGSYPSWLEPRALPIAASRRVFIDGVTPTTTDNNDNNQGESP
jgi:hypothetical protein